jgi:transcriptional regulator with XRE-family HTH domain
VYNTKNNRYGAKMPVTGYQIKAARSLVGMEQVQLAEKAGVSANTIRNMEAFGDDRVKVRTDTLDAVTDALKRSGVVFLEAGQSSEGGPGVRLDYLPPLLFRRDDQSHRRWISFAYEYKGKRETGFVHYDALEREPTNEEQAHASFDASKRNILRLGAIRIDRGEVDESGNVHIQGNDLRL